MGRFTIVYHLLQLLLSQRNDHALCMCTHLKCHGPVSADVWLFAWPRWLCPSDIIAFLYCSYAGVGCQYLQPGTTPMHWCLIGEEVHNMCNYSTSASVSVSVVTVHGGMGCKVVT